ncbi:MAG: ATP-binding protein [Muribaculaceae bacterium]|nr:ATP-binding protein [Muribaculaceae bacterium]
MKNRKIIHELRQLAHEFPVVSIYGPRQSGKTTLARAAFPDKQWISLEDPDVNDLARNDPRGFLNSYPNGAVFDEIQKVPELFSYLQKYVDSDPAAVGKYILTGSHQAKLKRGVAQSLAGRTAILTLLPYSIAELREGGETFSDSVFDLIWRGFYPRLHENNIRPSSFYPSYVATYLERDLPALLEIRNRSTFLSFLFLLASRTGQILNLTALGAEVGVSATTVSAWVSALEESSLVFKLQGWSRNATTQVTKSPKIYFTDTGLAAWLAKIRTPRAVAEGVLRGGFYENFVLIELLKEANARNIPAEFRFFRSKSGDEVDIVVDLGDRIVPVEVKSSTTFRADFLHGLESFRQLVPIPEIANGAVAFNGHAASRETRGVMLANPLDPDFADRIFGTVD